MPTEPPVQISSCVRTRAVTTSLKTNQEDNVVLMETNLTTFCTEIVPEFAPLGGGRPDCAVVLGQLVSQHDTRSITVRGGAASKNVCLPPDVADTGMALLCSPIKITSLEQKLNFKHHEIAACRLQLETTEELEALSDWIPLGCMSLKLEFRRCCQIMAETPENFLSNASVCPVSIDLSGTHCVTLKKGFASHSAVSSVRLPATLEEIGHCCFTDCSRLTAIDLQSTAVKVIKGRFANGCEALTDVRFPTTLEEIGYSCFNGCTSLNAIDLQVTAVKAMKGRFANGCKALTDVRFPVVLEEIGFSCFEECTSLATIDLQSTALKVINSAFAQGSKALTDARLPATLEEIGYRCFDSCTGLETVDLHSTAVRVLKGRFANGCGALTDVRLPPTLEEIDYSCFEDCTSLATIDLQSTAVQIIKSGFVHGCESLTDIRFPATLEEIGDCFFYCTSLVKIDFQATAVRVIGRFAKGCEALTDVRFPVTLEMIDEKCYAAPIPEFEPTSLSSVMKADFVKGSEALTLLLGVNSSDLIASE